MIKEFVKKNYICIILGIIILTQTALIIYCFEVKKKDFHSDEIWSYGPANSYDTPVFYSERPRDRVINHYHEWVPGEELDSYVTVRRGERFAYGAIYRNITQDLHQPMYYWLLHTICSFFPDVFSWWFGFGLNLIFFIGSQILLFVFVKNVTGNNFLAVLTCFTYGFNQGAIDTYVYIRMYSMVTFLGLLTCCLHTMLWKDAKRMKKILPAICIVTIIGGLTHVYFYVFACVVSACFCFYYLFGKKFKQMFAYAGAMLGAVAVSFIIYPYAIGNAMLYTGQNGETFSSGYGGFWFEMRYLRSVIIKEITGIDLMPMPSYFFIHLAEILLLLVVVLVPLSFVLRNEEWFQRIVRNSIKGLKYCCAMIKDKVNIMVIVSLAVVMTVLCVTGVVSRVYIMGNPATRYVFHIYPYLFFIAVGAVYGLLCLFFHGIRTVTGRWGMNRNKPERCICICLAAAVTLASQIYSVKVFYFEYNDIDFYLDEMPREANYILQLKDKDYWLLDCVSSSLYGIENIFPVIQEGTLGYGDEMNELNSDAPVYLILQVPTWKEMLDDDGEEIMEMNDEFNEMLDNMTNVEDARVEKFLSEYRNFYSGLDISSEFTYMGISEVFGRKMFVFKLRS